MTKLFFRADPAALPASLPLGGAAGALGLLAGTMIAVPGGARRVEMLKAGDIVLNEEGRAESVRWAGRRHVLAPFAGALRGTPVLIRAGALADDLPLRDLWLAPDHALLLDGMLIEAAALVNGASILRGSELPELFTYCQVELPTHALILAEGVAVETFLDRHGEAWEGRGDCDPLAEMECGRAHLASQAPAALTARLAARRAEWAPREAAPREAALE